MPRARRRHPTERPNFRATERGQASVELVAAIPAVLLAGLLAWQLVIAGHAAWLCANAARVAARAAAVDGDAERAARSALPASLERGLAVQSDDDGRVRVRLRLPILLNAWRGPLTIGASSRLESEP